MCFLNIPYHQSTREVRMTSRNRLQIKLLMEKSFRNAIKLAVASLKEEGVGATDPQLQDLERRLSDSRAEISRIKDVLVDLFLPEHHWIDPYPYLDDTEEQEFQ